MTQTGQVKREVLGIIQARGGSKGVPRKNLLLLGDHPLIAYSIASGLSARSITRLIVSTDDDEIAEVSMRYGAEVPFRRPAELSSDAATDYPLFLHALTWLQENEGYIPGIVVQLRPTAPFRPRGFLDEAIQVMLDNPGTDCVRAVTSAPESPYKMYSLNAETGLLVPLLECDIPEPYNAPRQKLPKVFSQTGHVDVIDAGMIRTRGTLTGQNVRPIFVDPMYSVDIDTTLDFDFAAWRLQHESLSIDLPSPVTS